jgi:hypothetical protein
MMVKINVNTLIIKYQIREMISSTRHQIHFQLQTSYVNDVVTRDMFLKPINTTQGRTKEFRTRQTRNNNL